VIKAPAWSGRASNRERRYMNQTDTETFPVVLVVPPFTTCFSPAIGVSILKEALTRHGIPARIVYANIMLAKLLGMERYNEVMVLMGVGLIGECLFKESAYALERPEVPDYNYTWDPAARLHEKIGMSSTWKLSQEEWYRLNGECASSVKRAAYEIAVLQPRIVGFSSSLQQINSSIALAGAVKRLLPGVITVIGGSNCDGVMGEEIASHGFFDYVFQGEADFTFPDFCRDYLHSSTLPPESLVRCNPPEDLDAVSTPDYRDYFAQLDPIPRDKVIILFESSRGCWWGLKRQCAFCGINGAAKRYRSKSARHLLSELESLKMKHPEATTFFASDSICPYTYFSDLFPMIAARGFQRDIIYEMKSNLSLSQLLAMRKAGITKIVAGVESLSTRLLRLMHKGSNAADNIRMLRDCRTLDISPHWNLLVGVPGDCAEDYRNQARLIPMIQHLTPPQLLPVFIQRFSPYFEEKELYGITDVRPYRDYDRAFPEYVDRKRIALLFSANIPSASREDPDILDELMSHLRRWRQRWRIPRRPALRIRSLEHDRWLIEDSRDFACEAKTVVDVPTYNLLKEHQTPKRRTLVENELIERLRTLGYLVEIDGKLLSVVCGMSES
jgi:ribosomal peptide maturation radical SAM protein 1